MSEELTAKEASERYDFSISYLLRLVKDGRIQGRKLGPIWLLDKASLDTYAGERHKPGPPKGQPATWRKKQRNPEESKTEGRAAA